MYRLFHFFYFIGFSGLFGCAGTQPASQGNTDVFNDNLAEFRPVFDEPSVNTTPVGGVPELPQTTTEKLSLQIDEQLQQKLAKMVATNGTVTTVPGYTIQVYVGASRTKANQFQDQAEALVADDVWLDYRQPNYLVKVGKYYNRFEANEVLAQLRKEFKQALLLEVALPLNN